MVYIYVKQVVKHSNCMWW